MNHGISQLAGRTALITGAAHGIGRELALALAAQGCHLALLDIDEQGLNELRRRLESHHEALRCSLHVVDVADRASMSNLPRAFSRHHDRLEILINNAGVACEASFPRTSLETWDRIMGVNLWGVIHGCHFMMPLLAKSDVAHIVNMSSLLGLSGMPGQTAYCTTKYAVRGLSECLWEELRATTIGLTVVYPGSVATDIMRTAKGDDAELMAQLAEWYEQNAYAPARAAEQIVAAIRKGKPRLLISSETFLVDVIKRMMPVWGNKIVADLILQVLGLEHMREKRRIQWEQIMVESSIDVGEEAKT